MCMTAGNLMTLNISPCFKCVAAALCVGVFPVCFTRHCIVELMFSIILWVVLFSWSSLHTCDAKCVVYTIHCQMVCITCTVVVIWTTCKEWQCLYKPIVQATRLFISCSCMPTRKVEASKIGNAIKTHLSRPLPLHYHLHTIGSSP